MTVRKYNARLKEAIKKSGRLQWWVAQQSGVSQFNLSQIINGQQIPNDAEQKAIARTLQVKRSHIF